MGTRGPMPKATEAHANAGFARGAPKMPPGLSDEAKSVWKFVCDQIPEDRSSPADLLAIAGLSRWFAQWDRLMKSLENDPADARMQRQAASAWQLVEQSLRQFGLTMVSRAR